MVRGDACRFAPRRKSVSLCERPQLPHAGFSERPDRRQQLGWRRYRPPDLPFILDPQNAGTVLLGTCRIWRGTTSGGAFQLLSPNFETGGAGTCIGTEMNQVRAM